MFKVTFIGDEAQRGCIAGKQLRPGESIEMETVPPELKGSPNFQVEDIGGGKIVSPPKVVRVGDRIAEPEPEPEPEEEKPFGPEPVSESKDKPAPEPKPEAKPKKKGKK